jgi:hypothetical protein
MRLRNLFYVQTKEWMRSVVRRGVKVTMQVTHIVSNKSDVTSHHELMLLLCVQASQYAQAPVSTVV